MKNSAFDATHEKEGCTIGIRLKMLFPREDGNTRETEYERLVMAMRGDKSNAFGYDTFAQWREAFHVPSNYREVIDSVLLELETPSPFTPREVKALRMGFGFDREGRCCDRLEMAKTFGVTTERVRQITAKALRKLAHYFDKLDEPARAATIEVQIQELLAELKDSDAIESLLGLSTMPIRTVHVLKKYEIYTIGDLKKLRGCSSEELTAKMPYLGKKAAADLSTIICEM